jgi:hypothetical protein
MTIWRCNSCRGTYSDLSADGVPYFHACAPVTRTYIRQGQGPETLLAGEMPAGAVVVRVDSVEHPDTRDENLRQVEQVNPAGKVGLVSVAKSEGRGRTEVTGAS